MTIFHDIYTDAKLDQGYDASHDDKHSLPWYIVHSTIFYARTWLCALRGHDWENLDIGDPEVGPNPDFYCRRCFHQPR